LISVMPRMAICEMVLLDAERVEVEHVVDAARLDLLLRKRRDGDRHVLQLLFALLRGDHHGLQRFHFRRRLGLRLRRRRRRLAPRRGILFLRRRGVRRRTFLRRQRGRNQHPQGQ